MLRNRCMSAALAVLFTALPLGGQGVPQGVVQGASPAGMRGGTQVTGSGAVATDSVPAVVAAPTSGPTVQNAAVGVRATATQPAPLDPRRPDPVGHNQAMMIVGGAALIVGAVIGGTSGTIIMIGGGIIGLVGLWQYLQ